MEAQELTDALEAMGYKVRPYSGRGMFGKTCPACTLDDIDGLFNLGYDFGHEDYSRPMKKVKVDNLGSKIIAYWPEITF